MCPNDSPSQKRDGAATAAQTPITTEQLQTDYAATIDALRHAPLPDARAEELVTACVDVQQRLDNDSVDSETALELVTVVAEAMADVRDATVVTDPPESRALDTGVPTDDYTLTPDERDETLGVLSSLLFTVAETPGVGRSAVPVEIVQ
ncbi:MAG: hypothetical protein J07HB67_02750 [halophilic archaeon J07HB67]|jgi:hypothetical protein|nr:MAG: hypothetical protein J07HB67_02750 [halophilic archaeon J07HB67]